MTVEAGPNIETTGLTLSLDPGNTKSYPGSGTAWTDMSGNGNNAVMVNAPTLVSSNGGYFSFNGTNQYGYIPYSASLAPTTAETASVWAYLSDWAGQAASLRFISKTETGGFNLAINDIVGSVSYARHLNGVYYNPAYAKTNFTAGWHHIVGTCDGRYSKLYIDGKLVDTKDAGATYSLTYTYTNNVIIAAEAGAGSSNSLTGNYLPGYIGMVNMYNVALSATQIEMLFNAQRGKYGI